MTPRLIEISDIKGDLHLHTKESDGMNTTEEMIAYDLDPQTNATVSLMDENRWLEQDKKGNTIR